MSEKKSDRRNFLKMIGLTASVSLVSQSALASFVNHEEIRKLNPEQQEFMVRYGKWMDEFIKVIRIQKKDPADLENQKQMVLLTEKALEFKPQLLEMQKDLTFSLIFNASIQRVTDEI